MGGAKRECGEGWSQIRSCPRNCKRRAFGRLPLGHREGGAKAGTREPGDLPSLINPECLAGVPGKERDLEFDETIAVGDPCVEASASAAVTIIVCSSCRDASGSDARPRPGELLGAATREANTLPGVRVEQVECLGNCKRRLSAAFIKPGAWSYVFGDLGIDTAHDLIAGARLFQQSTDGLMPWRGRPDCLKRGLVARIPPPEHFAAMWGHMASHKFGQTKEMKPGASDVTPGVPTTLKDNS